MHHFRVDMHKTVNCKKLGQACDMFQEHYTLQISNTPKREIGFPVALLPSKKII
jgi:hypothetical protein